MRLSQADLAALDGLRGEAARIAMELVVSAAEAVGASELLDITSAHVDSCLYHGQVSLDFAKKLAGAGARVAVPTTLNVASLDLLHPDLYRGDPETASNAKVLMDTYLAMGCEPTWTCAPYQLRSRPALGDQVAWGESNAIVFVNSVIGARTERYGDFLDICCAVAGRAPSVGLHTDAGRRATILVDLDLDETLLDDDLSYVALGLHLGRVAGTAVAVITGLDRRADEDRLKALGAAAASSGAVAMFHALGVTPEAATLEQATGGAEPQSKVVVDGETLRNVVVGMGGGERLGAVSIGTPHASVAELEDLATACAGLRTRVPFYVSTGRDVLASVSELVPVIQAFGATLVTDTCTYVTPIMNAPDGVVMTNSGKWAYYAPGNLGVEVVLGTLDDCVRSAAAGSVLRSGAFA